jgi:hypothetical protein
MFGIYIGGPARKTHIDPTIHRYLCAGSVRVTERSLIHAPHSLL